MQLRTHLKIDKSLSGEVVELSEGYAKLRLKTDSRMVADDKVDYDKAGYMLERNIIEIAPLAFMRGRTLNDAFIILDEAQNSTKVQMKMFQWALLLGHSRDEENNNPLSIIASIAMIIITPIIATIIQIAEWWRMIWVSCMEDLSSPWLTFAPWRA